MDETKLLITTMDKTGGLVRMTRIAYDHDSEEALREITGAVKIFLEENPDCRMVVEIE